MNVRSRNNVWKFFTLFAALFSGVESNGAFGFGGWFGGAPQESAAATTISNANAGIDATNPTDQTPGTGGADLGAETAALAFGASNAAPPLYAEGEEEALSAFQRGMINIQEFAATTLSLANESSRRVTSSGLIAEAEWLNWRVSSTNTLYSTSYSSSGNFISGDRFALTSKGNGVRARLGKRFDDCWDMSFCYTYFEGSDSGTQTTGTDYYNSSSSVTTSTIIKDFVDFTATAPTPTAQTIAVTGDVAARLNIFDLEFGRWIRPNESFGYRPFGGLRVGKTYEKYGGVYSSGLATTLVEQSTQGTGYGIRGGGEGKWNFAKNWSVFGSGSLSVLATTLVNKTYQHFSVSGSSESEIWLDYDTHSRVATPVLDVEAGVSWQKGGWEIKGGYELSDWFNTSNLDAPGGDLLFYGYFAGASWNF